MGILLFCILALTKTDGADLNLMRNDLASEEPGNLTVFVIIDSILFEETHTVTVITGSEILAIISDNQLLDHVFASIIRSKKFLREFLLSESISINDLDFSLGETDQ